MSTPTPTLPSDTLLPRATARRLPLGTAGRFITRLALRKPLGFAGFVILVVAGAAALAAPVIAPYPFDQADYTARLEGPSVHHWFGTDQLGRDLFSRILFGTRNSAIVAFAAVALGISGATVVAVISGFYGSWFDKLVQRFIDIWLAIPGLVLIISMVAVLGPGIQTMIVVIGLVLVPGPSRLIRSVVMSVCAEAYVDAGRAIGASDQRLLIRYILPNITHIVVYSATVALGSVILVVASLGFLGYGVPPPQPDLGGMLSGAGLQFMRRSFWLAIWPGAAITLIVFSFNVFGDALRDLLDPRLRGR